MRVDSNGIGAEVELKVLSGELGVLESVVESVAVGIDMELVGTNAEWDELGEEAVARTVGDEEGGTVEEEAVLSIDTVVLEAEPEVIVLIIDDEVLLTDNGATVLSFDTDTLDREEVKLKVDEEVVVLRTESEVEGTEVEAPLGVGMLEEEVGVRLLSFDDEVTSSEVELVAVSTEGEVLMLSVDIEVDETMVVVILISVGSV